MRAQRARGGGCGEAGGDTVVDQGCPNGCTAATIATCASILAAWSRG
jgi:hypothetical protein